MLRTRVLSAAALLAIVAAPAFLGGLPFFALIALIGALAVWEYARLLHQENGAVILPLAIPLALLFIGQAQWADNFPIELALTLAVLSSLIGSLWRKSAKPVNDWALTLAGALYLGWLLGLWIRLRSAENGLEWLLLAACPVWAADVAAYFAGRAFGRHPFWPRHSPKKTWEGYLAGIAGAVLVAGLIGAWLLQIGLLESMALGLLIGAIAPLGDLAESMIKRQAGAKDSSHLIPGHGGVLDRIDSLLIAAPLVYLWAIVLAR